MPFIFNDAQTSKTVYGETSSASALVPEDGLDLSGWQALQQQMLLNAGSTSPLDIESVIAQSKQNDRDTVRVGEAKREFLMLQAKINVETQSDSFIKDSITGK